MNRNMSEIGSTLLPPHRQRETAHRYMLGLYRVLGTLKERFPKIKKLDDFAGKNEFIVVYVVCKINQTIISRRWYKI